MEFQDVMAQRHSVRAFTDQPVSDALLNELLARASGAPSWSNTQPYQIAVARGEVLESLRRELPERFDQLMALQRAPMVKKLKALVTKKGMPDGDYRPVVKYPDDLQPRRVATGHGLYGKTSRPATSRWRRISVSLMRQWRFLCLCTKAWGSTAHWMRGFFYRA